MPSFNVAEFTRRFEKSFARLPADAQAQCRKAVGQIVENSRHPGLHVKPLQPAKIHWEARLNRGDRIIFRPAGPVVYFLDIVPHDEIDRFGG